MATDTPGSTGLLPIRPDPVLPLKASPTALEKIKNGPPKRTRSASSTDATFSRNQLAFMDNWMRGMNPRAAMIAAGYSKNSLPSELLYNPKIWNELQKRYRVHYEKQKITTQEVLEGIDRLAASNILDYVDVLEDGSFKLNLTNVNREMGEAIQGLEFDSAGRPRIKLVDKIAARALQARAMGMLKDKVEVTGKDGAPLSIKDFDTIRNNTTINIQNINIGHKEEQHIPDTIEAEVMNALV